MAMAAGVALPGHMLLFGRVINEYVFHDIAVRLTRNESMEMEQHFCADANSSVTSILSTSLIPYIEDPRGTLLREISTFSFYYVGMATAVLIATFLATVFWNGSAYRQTRRMRAAFYRSILKQNIGWFDVTESNQLSTRLLE